MNIQTTENNFMSFDFYLIIFLILHAIISLIMFVLIKTDVLEISMQLFVLILFLPICGIFITLKADKYLRKNLSGSREIQLEKLNMLDNDYKAISMTDDSSEQSVVPLEEAILINDQETRRKIMIDVLKQDPKQYVNLLQRARENDDIEVTHYASTAIMEIQREYEIQIRLAEKNYKINSNDVNTIETYIFAIRDYIHSGLMQDSLLYMQRQRYDSILTKRLEYPNTGVNLYIEAINNLIEMGIFQKANKLLDEAILKWSKNEDILLTRIKYYHLTGNAVMLKSTLSDITKSRSYLSPSTQQKLSYWNNQ
ncbi:MAG: hypothetical protein A2Y17_03545 [Clostridiales bacterium GWF2_38_85]|nr:MAG: hypothetical protein A2Y17_03545 [Clostridiales bacterium GWF2_38_85]HBL85282.1 hypothetical protein [Clostridiales bacterium]